MIFIGTIYDIPLEDAVVYQIQINEDTIAVWLELYNAQKVCIKCINYYKFIDNHSIGCEIGDFEIHHASHFIQQILRDEITGGASRKYIDEMLLSHLILFEPWERKKIMEIVYEKLKIQYV